MEEINKYNKYNKYNNTIFYKIYCKDENVTDKYIGHTTNFIARQKQHKRSCINPASDNHNCKVYQFIRNNNGWYNWNMEIIAFHKCENLISAKKYEQQYFEEHNATLNSIEPLKTHHNVINTKNSIKTELAKDDCCKATHTNKLYCEKCDYNTSRKSSYTKHLSTSKHANNKHSITSSRNNKILICKICEKEYKSRVGLWRHSKNCNEIIGENVGENVKSIIDTLNNNDELKDFLIEQNKQLMEQLSQQNHKIMEQLSQHNQKIMEQNQKIIEMAVI